uniref:Adenylate kinase n=1 Tax=Ditylenchus dipsaci TaxID=166011 RepID=A0A915E888_9BILA
METSKNKTLVTSELKPRLPIEKFNLTQLNGCYAHIFFIVGYPGAGKGTQSKLIASKYGLEHLSVGDYIRAEIAAGSPRSAMLADKLRKAQDGKPFPLRLGLDIIKEFLMKQLESKSHWPGFLIDGFPIKEDEVIQFECEIQACTCVLHFDIADKEALFQRLLKRGKSRQFFYISDNNYDFQFTVVAVLKTTLTE